MEQVLCHLQPPETSLYIEGSQSYTPSYLETENGETNKESMKFVWNENGNDEGVTVEIDMASENVEESDAVDPKVNVNSENSRSAFAAFENQGSPYTRPILYS